MLRKSAFNLMHNNFFNITETKNDRLENGNKVKSDPLISAQHNEGSFFSFENCPVKVSFTDCPVEERKRFYSSHCIMPISVGLGLKVHEGSKFLGTLKLINASFKSFTILLDDSIQRYNISSSRRMNMTQIFAKP